MTPPPGPKTTDQRQASGIAEAVLARLRELDPADLASYIEQGERLLADKPVDWVALLDWNRRACEWLADQYQAQRRLVEVNRKR